MRIDAYRRARDLAEDLARIRKHREFLEQLQKQQRIEQERIKKIKSVDSTKGQKVDVYV